jgi:two-component system, NarL family, nitrate/nitrite response regulator NarL
MNGDVYVPPLMVDETDIKRLTQFSLHGSAHKPVLTERQVAVLRSISVGRSNKAIAIELGLSEKTVKAHITAIFKILNVINRAKAVAVGRENGII